MTLPGLPSASGKIEEASEDGRERSAPLGRSLVHKGRRRGGPLCEKLMVLTNYCEGNKGQKEQGL